ncbi:BMP family protein [Homoserinimonas hongtaonis]|uniref:BMP family ABC transporter substrate-binding protein n=1 Tax=Homoserinimonas hongtaonis TaxID=2079791 RepID=A0A2U1SYE2_9MICO|nr:BMP family protein [Salinibacterium hongtaonis]AWB89169.1 BMP family ABC transporter substrate-binding protein [Salinibacterium hongtaonis]PWB96618.1 BMP family ABC transporter substrate-binding protein [Salinibacterium hongtaonis]
MTLGSPRTPGYVKRGLTALSLASVAALVLAGCGGTTGAEPAADGESASGLPLVFGAYATPLEEPWDGAIHAALESAEKDGLIEYKHIDNLHTADEMERALRDIASNQSPDIIIGDAFAAEDAVREVAAEYPDIAFAFGSGGSEQAPNFSVFDNWMQDPAYLAGMLAGGLTESNTIGVVGAMPIPEVNRIVNAFIAGVGETNPAATVTVSFINSFFDPATAKQAAEAAIAGGADVLFAERDGVIAAASEHSIPVFGMMVDQEDQAPDYVASSLLWNVRPTVDAIVEAVVAGNYKGVNLAEYSFMVNGGSSLAPINSATVYEIPADLIAKVEARQAEILDGTFETPINENAPAGSTTVGK